MREITKRRSKREKGRWKKGKNQLTRGVASQCPFSKAFEHSDRRPHRKKDPKKEFEKQAEERMGPEPSTERGRLGDLRGKNRKD